MLQLRVATWNIHKGVTGLTGRLRIHAVQQGVQALEADVLCLQEVQDINQRLQHARWRGKHHPGGRQIEFLAQGEFEHFAYGPNALYDHGHHGNAVLSRLPMLRWENVDISDHRFEQRGLLHTVLRLPAPCVQGELHVLCVHLGLFAGSRRRQAQALIERVEQLVPRDAPLLIAGDFNDWRNHLHDPLVKQLNVQEAFVHAQQNGAQDMAANMAASPQRTWLHAMSTTLQAYRGRMQAWWRAEAPATLPAIGARTFPSHLPTLSLDRLYVRGCTVASAWVPQGHEWRSRSDHAPLCATLQFATHPTQAVQP